MQDSRQDAQPSPEADATSPELETPSASATEALPGAAVLGDESASPHAEHHPERWLRPFFYRGVRPFLLLVLVYSLYMAYTVLESFLTQIILATVLAALFAPVQEFLSRRLRGRRSLAALGVVLLIFCTLLAPLYFVTAAMVQQGLDLSGKIKTWVDAGGLDAVQNQTMLADWQSWLRENTPPYIKLDDFDLEGNLVTIFRNVSERFLKQGASILGDAAGLLTNFFIMMFMAFYLVRDGRDIVKKVKDLSPLREEQEDRIIGKVKAIARSVLMGSLATAVLQGLFGAIGFAIVGIPAVFWGVMVGFASLVPVLGTMLVWVPAVGYLLIIGETHSALILGLWFALLVGSIDNFGRPYLMQGEAELSPFYIFLALIGGFQAFGIRGLLYGPLILGFAKVMLVIYQEEFSDTLDKSKTYEQF